jgi:hypothetical protein
MITTFAAHPITEGLEQVILPFASPISWVGDSTLRFTPLAFSSAQSGTAHPPLFFDVSREWRASDFPESGLVVAGMAEGSFGGSASAQLVVIGDGDFPTAAQSPDNTNLLVNSFDFLADDTGLIALRTKGVSSRPIHQEILADDAEGQRTFYKYLNFGLPILLVILYGLFRSQQQRNLRLKRMQQKFN